MARTDNENEDFEENKNLIHNLSQEDGRLVSPIDLSLEITRPVELPNLKWMNIDDAPLRMKLTNTGETVIVSAKWNTERPYLAGGPLIGNYVFSQIHFHWGSDEHEGSEHTVKGIRYPMEMHAVFYKTRYLTQEAALKHNDGIVVVVYLVKLQSKSCPGLRWISSQLNKIAQPKTSTALPLSPLSSLIVPFTEDYLLYWGSIVTHRCSHVMLWFVSRAALSVTVEDLTGFRTLQNSEQQLMMKNFRGASHPQGRTVFHVNPSTEKKHLLLPGTIDPPGLVLVVNRLQVPEQGTTPASKLLSKGDSCSDELEQMSNATLKTYIFYEESNEVVVKKSNENLLPKISNVVNQLNDSSSIKNVNSNGVSSSSSRLSRVPLCRKIAQNRKYVMARKILEAERRQEENKDKSIGKNKGTTIESALKIKRNRTHLLAAKSELDCNELKNVQNKTEKPDMDFQIEENIGFGLCLNDNISQFSNLTTNENQVIDMNIDNAQTQATKIITRNKLDSKVEKKTANKTSFKSKLPVKVNCNKPVLQSSLCPYFSKKPRPESAPQTQTISQGGENNLSSLCRRDKIHNTVNPLSLVSNLDPNGKSMIRKPMITTIPKPLLKNIEKFDENLQTNNNPRHTTTQPKSFLMRPVHKLCL